MYIISKEFTVDFGHRIWTQEVDKQLSNNAQNKCRFLHGHTAKIVVNIVGDTLEGGMVTDFNNLNWFKEWLDEWIDHRFVIDTNDPMMNLLYLKYEIDLIRSKVKLLSFIKYNNEGGGFNPDYMGSFTFINCIPSAENMARLLYNFVQGKIGKHKIKIHSVEFWETPKSKAVYIK